MPGMKAYNVKTNHSDFSVGTHCHPDMRCGPRNQVYK